MALQNFGGVEYLGQLVFMQDCVPGTWFPCIGDRVDIIQTRSLFDMKGMGDVTANVVAATPTSIVRNTPDAMQSWFHRIQWAAKHDPRSNVAVEWCDDDRRRFNSNNYFVTSGNSTFVIPDHAPFSIIRVVSPAKKGDPIIGYRNDYLGDWAPYVHRSPTNIRGLSVANYLDVTSFVTPVLETTSVNVLLPSVAAAGGYFQDQFYFSLGKDGIELMSTQPLTAPTLIPCFGNVTIRSSDTDPRTSVPLPHGHAIDGSPFLNTHYCKVRGTEDSYVPVGAHGKALFPYATEPSPVTPWDVHGTFEYVSTDALPPEFTKLQQQGTADHFSWPCILIRRPVPAGKGIHVVPMDHMPARTAPPHPLIGNAEASRTISTIDLVVNDLKIIDCVHAFLRVFDAAIGGVPSLGTLVRVLQEGPT